MKKAPTQFSYQTEASKQKEAISDLKKQIQKIQDAIAALENNPAYREYKEAIQNLESSETKLTGLKANKIPDRFSVLTQAYQNHADSNKEKAQKIIEKTHDAYAEIETKILSLKKQLDESTQEVEQFQNYLSQLEKKDIKRIDSGHVYQEGFWYEDNESKVKRADFINPIIPSPLLGKPVKKAVEAEDAKQNQSKTVMRQRSFSS